MKSLELRRHAQRKRDVDHLSQAGRAQAEDVGRTSERTYAMVFVSPAQRAAETAAWFLRGAGQQLPDHAVIAGLAGQDASGGSPEGMAAGVLALLNQLSDATTGLAISHTPFVERAAFGLAGMEVEPMAECEGILVTEHDDGRLEMVELRLDPGPT